MCSSEADMIFSDDLLAAFGAAEEQLRCVIAACACSPERQRGAPLQHANARDVTCRTPPAHARHPATPPDPHQCLGRLHMPRSTAAAERSGAEAASMLLLKGRRRRTAGPRSGSAPTRARPAALSPGARGSGRGAAKGGGGGGGGVQFLRGWACGGSLKVRSGWRRQGVPSGRTAAAAAAPERGLSAAAAPRHSKKLLLL